MSRAALPATPGGITGGRHVPWISSLVAIAVAGLLAILVPFGNDTAAHLYLTQVFSQHGFAYWDNYWYFGRVDFVGYSYLYYPLAAVLGVKLPAVAGLGAVGYTIGRILPLNQGQSGLAFLVSAMEGVLILTGAYPFLLALGLAGLALVALRAHKRWLYFLAALVSAASSPLALLGLGFYLVFMVARAWRDNGSPAPRALVTRPETLDLALWALIALSAALPTLVLHIRGYYPFYGTDFFMAAAFSVIVLGISGRLRADQAFGLRVTAGMYLVFLLVVFAVPSSIGGNAARVGEVSPVLIAACWVRGRFGSRLWRAAMAVAFWLSIVWMSLSVLAPLGDGSSGYLTNPASWRPLTAALAPIAAGGRVEYVDSLLHEGAWFLPRAGIPIARGWFRQDDFPANQLFYQPSLSASGYRSWLCSNQIRAVVLPPAPYDYSSVAEAALVGSGPSFLSAPREVGRFRIYTVTGCVTPGAQVVRISRDLFQVRIQRVGTYVVPLSYSERARSSAGSLSRSADGMTEVTVAHAGLITIIG